MTQTVDTNLALSLISLQYVILLSSAKIFTPIAFLPVTLNTKTAYQPLVKDLIGIE
jgi:hypothetical protein